MKQPTIVERFTDNGEHSHYALIETETGELLWSEAPEEEIQQVKNLNIPDISKSLPSDDEIKLTDNGFGVLKEAIKKANGNVC